MRQWKFTDSGWATETQLLAPDPSQIPIPIQWIEMAGFGVGVQLCQTKRFTTRCGHKAQAISTKDLKAGRHLRPKLTN